VAKHATFDLLLVGKGMANKISPQFKADISFGTTVTFRAFGVSITGEIFLQALLNSVVDV